MSEKIKILCDENIAFTAEAFSAIGEVTLSHGRFITAEMVKDYDVLLIRSITRVNGELLEGSNVKFVGTATIGRDHIDEQYLTEKGIAFSDAKGCNAQAVAEFVLSAVARVFMLQEREFKGATAGVIGRGNIGTKVSAALRATGFTVYINDPPLEKITRSEEFIPIEKALSADVITFHTPLERGGEFPTYHLLNEKSAEFVKENAIIVNASRGEVADTETLLRLHREKNVTLITDVWENEPDAAPEHIRSSLFSSPHTAGYTHRGKIQGTVILYQALCRFLGMKLLWKPPFPTPPEELQLPGISGLSPTDIYTMFAPITRLDQDTAAMLKMIEYNRAASGVYFDELRKNYPLRYELADFETGREMLKLLGLTTPL